MVDFHSEYATIRLSTPKGMTDYLREEAEGLGYTISKTDYTGVELKGTMQDCLHLNLHLYTAHKVLFLVKRFTAGDPTALYQALKKLPWENYLKPRGYFSIDSFVQNPHIKDTRFAGLKAKDAIADRFYEQYGKRPNSGPQKEQAVLFLYWQEDQAAIFLDTSGAPLSRHGYRKQSGEAPLSEALAAALIRASRWNPEQPFINPMCGTGTLAIEAALKALNRPPGLFRDNFAFMHLRGYDSDLWDRIRQEARQNTRQSLPGKIIASDQDPKALDSARENARRAGVLKFITFKQCSLEETPVPEQPGTVMVNPPYGERLGDANELVSTYQALGDFFKQQCRTYQGYIFTGNLELAKKIGLKPKCRIPFYNGKIECRLLGYDLY